jgi:hypothetical protein
VGERKVAGRGNVKLLKTDAELRAVLLPKLQAALSNPRDNGIQFVTDEGQKVAVQLDLKNIGSLGRISRTYLCPGSRRQEKRIPLEKVKAGLIKSGKLSRE